ncbi:hypothetical protein [Aerosakkonema funiforme]|nr:hypothetical protein [Aerosakkonema funiforme]
MNSRKYYSARTGKNPNESRYDLTTLRRLFRDLYLRFLNDDYFQEAFGYDCVDYGRVQGKLGSDIEVQMFRLIRKPDLWPIQNKCEAYSEDDLFDVIEFIYEHISKPINGRYHRFNDCGMHYNTFDKNTGQQEFREQVNQILCDYKEGYELSENGEILELPENGLENLFVENLPIYDHDNVEQRVESAIKKFRSYRSSLDEKHDAIRDLADVLEFLRPKIKELAEKYNPDEQYLYKFTQNTYDIANNCGIRHHNNKQKQDYDKDIWYNWIFYYYLATIHVFVRLIKKAESQST